MLECTFLMCTRPFLCYNCPQFVLTTCMVYFKMLSISCDWPPRKFHVQQRTACTTTFCHCSHWCCNHNYSASATLQVCKQTHENTYFPSLAHLEFHDLSSGPVQFPAQQEQTEHESDGLHGTNPAGAARLLLGCCG